MSHMRHTLALLLGLSLVVALVGCQRQNGSGASRPPHREVVSPFQAAELREDAIDLLLTSARAESAEARANALEALQQVPERSRLVVQAGLRDPNLAVRYVAAVSVGKLRMRDLAAEVRPLLRDPDDSVRAAALYALYECGERIDITPLSALLMKPDPTVRGNVAFLLGELGNPSAMPLLRDAARSPMPRVAEAHVRRVQMQIAESLARLGDESALEAIRATLYAPPEHGEIQALAAAMIGRLGDQRSIDALILLTARREEFLSAEVRLACAASLAQLGQPQGGLIADRYRGHARPALRAQAAYVYGQIGDPMNLSVLRGMLSDPVELVRIYAASSIVRITSL